MALTDEQWEKIIQSAVDEFVPKWVDEIQERIDNDDVDDYTDEELLANSVDEDYANSYNI